MGDEVKVKQAISSTIGFEAVNVEVRKFMVEWVTKVIGSYMNNLLNSKDKSIDVNDQIMVRSPTGVRRTCTVIEIDGGKVKPHYVGFGSDFDEWLPKTSARILGEETTPSLPADAHD